MTEERTFSKAALSAMEKAKELFTLEENPLSPVGRGVNIKADIQIVRRKNKDGVVPTIKAGSYPFFDKNELLCFIDYESMVEEMTRISNEAKDNGSLAENADESGITQIIGGAEPINIKVVVRPILMYEPLIDADAGLSFSEVFVCAAVMGVNNIKTRSLLEKELLGMSSESTRTRGRTFVDTDIKAPNDRITNAMFGRDKGYLKPQDYFSDTAITLSTGKNISVDVLIENDFNINEAFERYQMNATDRKWFDHICTIAMAGETEISCSELLKLGGYKNPWDKSARPIMRQVFESANKMLKTRIAIDSTNERQAYAKNKGKELEYSVSLKPFISGYVSIDKFTDDTSDFSITLTPENPDDPITALPVAKYAADKGEILTLSAGESSLNGLRLNSDHQNMWRYIQYRINQKGTSNTILLETIFKNINLEDANRSKKRRMKDMLWKILEQKKQSGEIRDFSWKGSGSQEAVTVIPVKKNS